MKTRTVKVTRQLTMAKSVILEIPEGVTNDDLESCLYDRCNTYGALEIETSIHDMTEEEETIEVEDSTEPATEDFRATDPAWVEAMKDDQLLG